MKMIFKNKHGMVRSGWIIALCMAAFYALGYAFSALLIDALRMILDAASLDAASYDALVDWMSRPLGCVEDHEVSLGRPRPP